MKKIAAVLAALMLMLCGTAFAQEEVSVSLNWADFEAQVTEAGWQGEFVELNEISLKLFVPSVLKAVELTEEDQENGYIAYFSTEDQSAQIGVQYLDAQAQDLSVFADYLRNEEKINAELALVNGLPAVSYAFTNEDGSEVACLTFATEKGYWLEFSFAPVNDEGFGAVALVMMGSIQAAE